MSAVVMGIGMPLGRRNCILIGNALITIGGAIQASSYSVAQVIVGRVLCVGLAGRAFGILNADGTQGARDCSKGI